jgi:hypothetical protein
MKWQTSLLLFTLFIALGAATLCVILIGFPNTFPSINDHIQAEVMLALRNSPIIQAIDLQQTEEIWQYSSITNTTFNLLVNAAPISNIAIDTTNSQFLGKPYGEFIDLRFLFIITCRDAPLTNVTSITFNVTLPERIYAPHMTPLIGSCDVSGVPTVSVRLFATLPNTQWCDTMTCQIITPSTTITTSPLIFSGHVIYQTTTAMP